MKKVLSIFTTCLIFSCIGLILCGCGNSNGKTLEDEYYINYAYMNSYDSNNSAPSSLDYNPYIDPPIYSNKTNVTVNSPNFTDNCTVDTSVNSDNKKNTLYYYIDVHEGEQVSVDIVQQFENGEILSSQKIYNQNSQDHVTFNSSNNNFNIKAIFKRIKSDGEEKIIKQLDVVNNEIIMHDIPDDHFLYLYFNDTITSDFMFNISNNKYYANINEDEKLIITVKKGDMFNTFETTHRTGQLNNIFTSDLDTKPTTVTMYTVDSVGNKKCVFEETY